MKMGTKKAAFFLVLFLVIILACNTVNPEKNDESKNEQTELSNTETAPKPEKPPLQLVKPEKSSPCDATGSLEFEIEKTHDEVNQWKTEIFEYKIRTKNTDPKTTIWLMAYKHKADVFQDEDTYEWIKLVKLEPGKTDGRNVYWNYHHEKDATGVTSMIFDKIAGVYDTPECAASLEDTAFLESIAYDLPFDHE